MVTIVPEINRGHADAISNEFSLYNGKLHKFLTIYTFTYTYKYAYVQIRRCMCTYTHLVAHTEHMPGQLQHVAES